MARSKAALVRIRQPSKRLEYAGRGMQDAERSGRSGLSAHRPRAWQPGAPGLGWDKAFRDRNRYDLAVFGDFADHDRLVEVVALAIHLHAEARWGVNGAPPHGGAHLIDPGRAGRFDRGA